MDLQIAVSVSLILSLKHKHYLSLYNYVALGFFQNRIITTIPIIMLIAIQIIMKTIVTNTYVKSKLN